MTKTEAPTALEPGWLRRAWLRHLEETDAVTAAEFEYMLVSDLPEILEPLTHPERPTLTRDGVPVPDDRFVELDGIDASTAARLLEVIPDHALEQDYSGYAPPPGSTLTAVARAGGALTCGGDVVTPSLFAGRLRIWRLAAGAEVLAGLEPDLVALELPEWLDELPGEDYVRYLRSRAHCPEHGVTRQAWLRISLEHGLEDARRWPYGELARDPATGDPTEVRFLW